MCLLAARARRRLHSAWNENSCWLAASGSNGLPSGPLGAENQKTKPGVHSERKYFKVPIRRGLRRVNHFLKNKKRREHECSRPSTVLIGKSYCHLPTLSWLRLVLIGRSSSGLWPDKLDIPRMQEQLCRQLAIRFRIGRHLRSAANEQFLTFGDVPFKSDATLAPDFGGHPIGIDFPFAGFPARCERNGKHGGFFVLVQSGCADVSKNGEFDHVICPVFIPAPAEPATAATDQVPGRGLRNACVPTGKAAPGRLSPHRQCAVRAGVPV